MSQVKPSFVFGYWRPWKEDSKFFDSYFDYVKDVSLVKYGADTVGKYINQASKEQIQAINRLGQTIGRGMNVLSNQMSEINDNLVFLNRNLDIQIEQQKLSNLLLQNIAELLRVPDSEKERQHSIELGIKFFVNAQKDKDLYEDALEQLLKAEILMKQDYFVLHRIGCIYLYVEKYINPEKALDYFLRAAKYASVESDPKAVRLANVLTQNFATVNSFVNPGDNDNRNIIEREKIFKVIIKKAGTDKLAVVKIVKELTGLGLKEAKDFVDSVPKPVKEGIDKATAEDLKAKLTEAGADVEITKKNVASKSSNFSNKIPDNNSVLNLAADSYEKASFTAYVLGRFEDAVNYQSKALDFNPSIQNRFLLAKYQFRIGEKNKAIDNLEITINEAPDFFNAVFKEIDIINESEVVALLETKNNEITKKIKQLPDKCKTINSIRVEKIINELDELQKRSYEIKVAEFTKLEIELNSIIEKISELKSKIDNLINEIKYSKDLNINRDEVTDIEKKLEDAKELPLEKMKEIYNKWNNVAENNRKLLIKEANENHKNKIESEKQLKENNLNELELQKEKLNKRNDNSGLRFLMNISLSLVLFIFLWVKIDFKTSFIVIAIYNIIFTVWSKNNTKNIENSIKELESKVK